MGKASYLYFSFLLCLSTLLPAQSLDLWLNEVDVFLNLYVEEGMVDYSAIKEQPQSLSPLIEQIASFPIANYTPIEQKAFWINAYNLLVIHQVLQNYPISSPQLVTGFFDRNKFRVAGVEMTLNDLEKEKLLKIYRDARLHFVLVCAAKGCPPLANKAYRPDQLEEQLDQRTRLALNDPNFLQIKDSKKRIGLSELFQWYWTDFEDAGGIRDFINLYRNEPLPADYKITYESYDWQLNDKKQQAEFANIQSLLATQLLRPDQHEVKIFNSLYTEKRFDGFQRPNSRDTYFSSFIQYLGGYDGRTNWGFDFIVRSTVLNDFDNSSPFRALRFQTFRELQTFPCDNHQRNLGDGSICFRSGSESYRDTLQDQMGNQMETTGNVGLAHIGPKIKIQPFKKFPRVSLQQTLFIPIQNDLDGQVISFTQFFIDKLIGTRSQLFTELSFWTPVRPQFKINPFLKFFYSYFLTEKWTVYGMTTVPVEYGAGTKYLLHPNFEIELLYTYYLPVERIFGDARPQTFNLGLRYRY